MIRKQLRANRIVTLKTKMMTRIKKDHNKRRANRIRKTKMRPTAKTTPTLTMNKAKRFKNSQRKRRRRVKTLTLRKQMTRIRIRKKRTKTITLIVILKIKMMTPIRIRIRRMKRANQILKNKVTLIKNRKRRAYKMGTTTTTKMKTLKILKMRTRALPPTINMIQPKRIRTMRAESHLVTGMKPIKNRLHTINHTMEHFISPTRKNSTNTTSKQEKFLLLKVVADLLVKTTGLCR